MKKEIKVILELTEKEYKVLKDCLVYTLHRLHNHQRPRNINEVSVKNLIDEIQ
jgi:hypothetical protein